MQKDPGGRGTAGADKSSHQNQYEDAPIGREVAKARRSIRRRGAIHDELSGGCRGSFGAGQGDLSGRSWRRNKFIGKRYKKTEGDQQICRKLISGGWNRNFLSFPD